MCGCPQAAVPSISSESLEMDGDAYRTGCHPSVLESLELQPAAAALRGGQLGIATCRGCPEGFAIDLFWNR